MPEPDWTGLILRRNGELGKRIGREREREVVERRRKMRGPEPPALWDIGPADLWLNHGQQRAGHVYFLGAAFAAIQLGRVGTSEQAPRVNCEPFSSLASRVPGWRLGFVQTHLFARLWPGFRLVLVYGLL
jgi:hypothetical protein